MQRIKQQKYIVKKPLTAGSKKAELLTELASRYFGLVLSKESEAVRQQVLEAMGKTPIRCKKT